MCLHMQRLYCSCFVAPADCFEGRNCCVVPSGTFFNWVDSSVMVKPKAKTARQYAEAMIAVLPKVNPSSSSSGCDDAASYCKLFVEALEEMIMDESSVVSVLSQLTSRRETMVKARAELSLLPPMPVVGEIDVGVMAGAIADHSDMTSNEVATFIEKDPEAPLQLFTFMFGFHSGNKLSVDMREAGVFSQVMTQRDSRFAHRGAGFKHQGAYSRT